MLSGYHSRPFKEGKVTGWEKRASIVQLLLAVYKRRQSHHSWETGLRHLDYSSLKCLRLCRFFTRLLYVFLCIVIRTRRVGRMLFAWSVTPLYVSFLTWYLTFRKRGRMVLLPIGAKGRPLPRLVLALRIQELVELSEGPNDRLDRVRRLL